MNSFKKLTMKLINLIAVFISCIGLVFADTKYQIVNKKNNLCLTYNYVSVQNGRAIKFQEADCIKSARQLWYIKGDKIVSADNNKCLGYINNNPSDKSLFDCNSTATVHFNINNDTICAYNTNKCMGSNGYFYKYDKNDKVFRWKFVKA